MPSAYPKEAFAIGTNPTTGNAPPSGITNPVNTPPPSTQQGYNMNQPISTPQFYNPQAFGAAPPVSTPIPSGNQGNFGFETLQTCSKSDKMQRISRDVDRNTQNKCDFKTCTNLIIFF